MFQDFALFPHMSVAANVAFGKGRGVNIRDLLERLDLAPLARALPHELSGGQQRRWRWPAP